MSVVNMVGGSTTPDGATFVAKVNGGGPVRVAVADNPGMAGPVFTASQAVDAQGVAKVSITGLAPATRYHWQVEDNGVLDTDPDATGQFLTHSPLGLPGNFTVAMASCAGGSASVPGFTGTELAPSRVSNHPVFGTIADRGLAEGWHGFIHLGDVTYYDPGSGVFVPDASLTTYRTMWDDVLLQPNQAQLMRVMDWRHMWDDHEFGPNNSDGTFVDKANGAQVWRERIPHGPLPDAAAIYETWDINRTRFIKWDVRYNRSPNSDPDGPAKTMLGAAQKVWMEGLLANPGTAQFLVILSGSQWMFPDPIAGSDTWANFATERDELVEMFGDHGWLDKMCLIYGDRHAAGIDSGGFNEWGNFPILVASSLDSNTGVNIEGLYDTLDDTNGRNQYGSLQVNDIGSAIQVTLSAWRGAALLGSHQFTISQPPPPLTSGALVRTLTGSHRALFEARVLTTFQSGPEPAGTEISIIGGDVQMDATAEIQRTLELTTDGNKMFPRHNDDLLAPYGNEIFVRRGVDLGASGPLWVPLGIFRIDTPEQDDSPNGPVRLSCPDRMAGIIDGQLLEPRVFAAGTSIGGVFDNLVLEIYPDAVIAFDDNSGSSSLGRELVVERNRYQALRDLADGLGKILFWDGEGILRINSAPDPSEFVWEVNAGFLGVQVSASRRITRVGTFNAVVATGQGGDEVAPARGVAVDANPLSPTFFGGRFGKIPEFLESPLITTHIQANNAAAEMLRRNLGMHFNVDFRAVVNPSLIPYDPIRIRYEDGNRELHIMDRITIPLDAETPMSGSTREQTLVVVSNVLPD